MYLQYYAKIACLPCCMLILYIWVIFGIGPYMIYLHKFRTYAEVCIPSLLRERDDYFCHGDFRYGFNYRKNVREDSL